MPPLQARLVKVHAAIGPHQLPVKKILAINRASKVKISQSPDVPLPPTPAATPPNPAPAQTEQIAGIALPGAISTPFSNPGVTVQGNAFFAARHAQQQAMQQYEQKMMQVMTRQKREQEADFKLKQLQETLQHQAETHPKVTGNCMLTEKAQYAIELKCSNADLFVVIAPLQQQIAMLLSATQGTTKESDGFTFSKNGSIPLIIFNKNPSPFNGKIDTPAAD